LIVAVAVLGACNTTDGDVGSDLIAASTSGAAPADPSGSAAPAAAPDSSTKKQYTASDFTKSKFCPPIEISPQTEAMTIYERGHDKDPSYVRYQASITKTARECYHSGDTLTIKVGISGRVVAGPKGGAGTITLPIRVAVVKQIGGQKPFYSNLFKKSVTLSAPTFGTSYSEVYDQVSLKDRDLIIFVGFDEGK
jgi:hypothetical protein